MLEVKIKKRFPDFLLDVEFQTGEDVFGVLGESGCGKSLTLKCIAGIETPDTGRIVLNGRVLFDSNRGINVPARERKCGYLFQEYALFPHMTVEENIAAGAVSAGKRKNWSRTERREVVKQNVERFFLTGLEKKYPSELSGGQKQRVAIARMMATEPEVILLDEPFAAIDSYLKWKMEQQLTEWLDQVQVTTLLVSHNRDEIYRLCDRMGIIHQGHMEVCGDKKEIFQNPGTVSAAILTGCKNMIEANDMPENLRHAAEREIKEIMYAGIQAHDLTMRKSEEPDIRTEKVLCTARVERKIEGPFDDIYVVCPTEFTVKAIRVEIPRLAGESFVPGQQVTLEVQPEKILWLRG